MERRTRTTGRSKGLLRRAGLGMEASPLAQGFQAIVPWCAPLPRAFDALLVYSSRMAKASARDIFVGSVDRGCGVRFGGAPRGWRHAGRGGGERARPLHRRRHARVRRLGLDGRQSQSRHRDDHTQDRRGQVGACQGAAEHYPLPPRRAHHLRARTLSAMQRPARSQAHARRSRTHHAGGERFDAGWKDAAHSRGGAGGRGARLPRKSRA